MRAVEKNILVVSTVAPGRHRSEESENGDSLDSALNGEFSTEVNVDVDMDNEGSFNISKEFNATTHRKDETVTVAHETTTIKKTATKEEEASTSTKTIIDTKPIESKVKSDESLSTTEKIADEDEEEDDGTTKTKEQEASNKPDTPPESIIPEVVAEQPKIDETLLNEPLRPADNEILVDTSDISSTTTPLAALENIVAIRTDPSVIETIESARIELQPTREIPIEPEEEVTEQAEQKETSGDEGHDSEEESAAKRMKIEEVETKSEEVPLKDVSTKEVEPPVVEHSLEKEKEHEKVEEEAPKTVIVQELIEEVQKIEPEESEPIAEEVALEVAEEITEPIQKDEVPLVVDSITDEPTIPIVETTMSLDEDEPPAVSMEVVSANKMDTDENEAETALMDVDDEPMDQ